MASFGSEPNLLKVKCSGLCNRCAPEYNGVRNRCKGKLLPPKQKPPQRYLNKVEVCSRNGLWSVALRSATVLETVLLTPLPHIRIDGSAAYDTRVCGVLKREVRSFRVLGVAFGAQPFGLGKISPTCVRISS